MSPLAKVRGFTKEDAMTLARVEANLENLSSTVVEIRSGLSDKVDRLEREKVSHADLSGHYQRLEKTFERMEAIVSARLDNIERLKASRQEHDDAEARAVEKGVDHEKRLRALEQFRWKALGVVTAIAALVSFLNHKLLHFLEH